MGRLGWGACAGRTRRVGDIPPQRCHMQHNTPSFSLRVAPLRWRGLHCVLVYPHRLPRLSELRAILRLCSPAHGTRPGGGEFLERRVVTRGVILRGIVHVIAVVLWVVQAPPSSCYHCYNVTATQDESSRGKVEHGALTQTHFVGGGAGEKVTRPSVGAASASAGGATAPDIKSCTSTTTASSSIVGAGRRR